MSWSCPFSEPRFAPIGNSLVNVAEEEAEDDEEQEKEVAVVRRHSYPGYIPYTVKMELLARFASELQSEDRHLAKPAVIQDAESTPSSHQQSSSSSAGLGSMLEHSENSCPSDTCKSDTKLLGEVTTLLLQNVPGDVTLLVLTKILVDMGFDKRFNFLFVHADFITKRSKGLAVINFVSSDDAVFFVQAWSQQQPLGRSAHAGGAVQIVPSHDQGYDAVVARWATAAVNISNLDASQQEAQRT